MNLFSHGNYKTPQARSAFSSSSLTPSIYLLVCVLISSSRAVAQTPVDPPLMDLKQARVIKAADMTRREWRAVEMLVEEIQRRSSIRWRVTQPSEALTMDRLDRHPVVLVGSKNSLAPLLEPWNLQLKSNLQSAEGYEIQIVPQSATILIAGNDERGVLFGVGRLLRELRMGRGYVAIPTDFAEISAPETSLRGHQLGYRPKTNSYDAWDVDQWEQYYRDLAVFGTNAIELIPPRSDDDADSPHFPRPPMEMMVEMSRLADDYGLDVWIWYPALDEDYSKSQTVEFALREWEQVYRQLPRIDAIFVPGGDPGHTPPRHLMALLEKQASLLRKYHPNAQMWMSPQGFNKEWDDEFFEMMNSEPQWLDGIVFGPQVRTDLRSLRSRIPDRYPIRGYPDITHSMNCQHPVENWDAAFAITQGREVINPRPLSQEAIFRFYQQSTVGFLTYSEGCNDDVNKFIWSGLGWDSSAKVNEILRQYSRYFIGDRWSESFALGLLGLEENWNGPLLGNRSVESTLQRFQTIEKQAGPKLLHNWRFQQALYRTYYDAWLRDRLVVETSQKTEAIRVLENATRFGALSAIQQAEEILDRADSGMCSPTRRQRIDELAEALFQSIHMQLDTKLHQGQLGRGTSQETIDRPLNDRHWMKTHFESIRRAASEDERLAEIDQLLHRTDPGPGGFYDDLGDPSRQPHLVRKTISYEASPDFRETNFHGFDYSPDWPREWWDNVLSLYDNGFEMHYENLDPNARYRVRCVYAHDSIRRIPIQLQADGMPVHPAMIRPQEMKPVEFDIPEEATKDGVLNLRWSREPGHGGNGRGCQVAEVWLLRDESAGR